MGRIVPAVAADRMSLLLNLGIRTEDLSAEATLRCFAWMKDHKITFYDASYLAVAVDLGATLVTADETFARKMKGVGPIRLLKGLKIGRV